MPGLPSQLAVLLVVVASAATNVRAEDSRVLSHHTDITVRQDGSLLIVEKTRIYLAEHRLPRYLQRGIPVFSADSIWAQRTYGLTVLEVLCNGKPDPYFLKDMGGIHEVHFGGKEAAFAPGEHTLVIRYRITRRIKYIRDRDELYWTVEDGPHWVVGDGTYYFPCESVSATITLPKSVPAEKVHCQGRTGYIISPWGKDCTCRVDPNGKIYVKASRPLTKDEDMSFRITWPKGFVNEPTSSQKWLQLAKDNAVSVYGFIGVVLILAYYLAAWFAVGRNPEKGAVIPLFEPPEGLSPAAMRFVMRRGFDRICLSAALLSMASKGYITITRGKGKDFEIERKDTDLSDLPPEEQDTIKALGPLKKTKLSTRNVRKVRSAIDTLKKSLSERYQAPYFITNLKFFVIGLVLSGVFLATAALAASLLQGMLFAFVATWTIVWTFGFLSFWRLFTMQWKRATRIRETRIGSSVGVAAMAPFALMVLIGELAGLSALVVFCTIWSAMNILLIVLLHVRFHRLLKRFTTKGRGVMDQIEGFKMYLATAEKDLLETAHPPEKSPELFEKYLPYAVALGVENAWAEKFSDILAILDEKPSD